MVPSALCGEAGPGGTPADMSSSLGSSLFAGEDWARSEACKTASARSKKKQGSALDFVVQQVAKHDGMLELYKLGTLLNQKHPLMKKKVGKLRTFLSKHSSHLRVVTSHDVNGTPSDFVLLTGKSSFASDGGRRMAPAQHSRHARQLSDGKRRKAKERRARKRGGSVLGNFQASEVRRGGSRRISCDVPWEGWSPSDEEEEGDLLDSRNLRRGMHQRGQGWRNANAPSAPFRGRRSQHHAVGYDDDSLELSDSDFPIGTL